jgi:tRNA splicing endonuclease
MNETVCNAYVNEGTIPMETFLYGSDYIAYNEDHMLDAYIYCVALRCGEVYCQGIGL